MSVAARLVLPWPAPYKEWRFIPWMNHRGFRARLAVKNLTKLTKRKSVEIAQTSVEAARMILYISLSRCTGLDK